EKLFVQVMETRKTVLGAEHPNTLTSMVSLAYTWKSQGRVLEALALLKESCRLRHKVLGPDHPSTRDTVDALDDWQGEQDSILNERLPPLRPQIEQSVHTPADDLIASASKPVGRKRRVFMDIFQRR
ncbi:hypothetical protein BJY00DRAFT_297479, partial [Aspergillus carlsbadensis]